MSNHSDHSHIVGYKEPIVIFFLLVFFTLLTVSVAGISPSANVSILIAFSIASVKAFLVVRYFMHLKYEDRVFAYFLATALGTFGTVFTLVFADYGFRW